MLYMLLLFHDPKQPMPQDALEQHFALADEMRSRNAYVTSEALCPVETATTVRSRNGKLTTTDGPFAETREVFGGYYLVDCEDLDEAIGYAGRIPAIATGSVEIRPVWHVPGWPYEVGADRKRAD